LIVEAKEAVRAAHAGHVDCVEATAVHAVIADLLALPDRAMEVLQRAVHDVVMTCPVSRRDGVAIDIITAERGVRSRVWVGAGVEWVQRHVRLRVRHARVE